MQTQKEKITKFFMSWIFLELIAIFIAIAIDWRKLAIVSFPQLCAAAAGLFFHLKRNKWR